MSMSAVQSMFSTMDLLRKHGNADFEDEQQRKKARWDDEDRAAKMEEVKRQKAIQAQLEQDAAPALIDTEEQGPTRPEGIVGADGQALAPVERGQVSPTVNGKQYKTMAEAQAAKDLHDAPGAVVQRQSMTLLRNGAPDKAASLSKTGMQWDADMKADLDRRFNDDVEMRVKDWNTAAQFATESAFDGGAGQIQYRFKPSADGKSMVPEVSTDGQTWQPSPSGRAYPNDATGFLEAKQDLLRIPTEKKLAHIYARQKAEADAVKAAAQAKRESDRLDLERRRVEVMEERLLQGNGTGAGGKGRRGQDDDGAANDGQVDMGVIDKAIDTYLAPKDADGKDLPTDPKLKLFVRALAAKSPEAYQGDYEGAALAAVDVYQRALKTAGGDLNKAYLLVSAELDAAKTGVSDYTVAGADGKVMPVGSPQKPQAPGRVAKPATGAMAQLMAEDAAKKKAADEAEAQRRATLESEAAAAAQMTLEQIRALKPNDAFRLLNSPAGRRLDPRVKKVLEAQAIGNTVAPARIGPKL